MKTVRTFTKSRSRDERRNEDFVISRPGIVGVLDSSSGTSKLTHDGKTMGQVVGEVVRNALSGLDAATDAIRFVAEATKLIEQEKAKLAAYPLPHSGSVFFAIYNSYRREIWRLGDPWVIIDDRIYEHRIAAEETYSQFRAFVLNGIVAQGYKNYEIRTGTHDREIKAIYDQFIFQVANKYGLEYGYGVLNGDVVASPFVEIISVPNDARRLVLATDGYPEAPIDFDLCEQKLADALASDPAMFQWHKLVKGVSEGDESYDDRSFVEVELDP